ncbi:MAG: hypothetical protein IJ000_01990, partial [Paludibacteraceae bacterium]|nr:hypothetical protein [Paludibacteraceae bacterium]
MVASRYWLASLTKLASHSHGSQLCCHFRFSHFRTVGATIRRHSDHYSQLRCLQFPCYIFHDFSIEQ